MVDSLKAQVEPHIKRLACQVYTQLPEDKSEALQVLQYVGQIIFCLGEDWEVAVKTAAILPFQQEQKGPATRLRAVPEVQTDPQGKSNPE